MDVLIAYLIAKYQEANGYTFSKSFIGALIGIVGLTLLGVNAWLEM
jgi:hypothetical protein